MSMRTMSTHLPMFMPPTKFTLFVETSFIHFVKVLKSSETFLYNWTCISQSCHSKFISQTIETKLGILPKLGTWAINTCDIKDLGCGTWMESDLPNGPRFDTNELYQGDQQWWV
jgi:hypothetical protein